MNKIVMTLLLSLALKMTQINVYDSTLQQENFSLTPCVQIAPSVIVTTCAEEFLIGPEATVLDQENLEEEILYDNLDLLALTCYAEAGNQGVKGMQYVCDVILDRVDSPLFPDTIPEVIYQEGQFSVVGECLEKAGWNITEEAYEAVRLEFFGEERLDNGILYFATTPCNGQGHWKYKDHWFSYQE